MRRVPCGVANTHPKSSLLVNRYLVDVVVDANLLLRGGGA